ncbi:MAG TPA: hypothetical protein VN043_12695 [Rhodanobacter sp.]|nr:hypothetical protein [Rhodanobacter sp.]
MSETDTTSVNGHDADRLPPHTTPTWEVELLISGVAVFAMLQLPNWFDNQLFALIPRLGTDLAGVVLPLYIYLKSAAVILAVTFSLHLLLRAHWIALVGMHSVYPDGVRWEKLRAGPVQREIEQRTQGSAAASIERADNRATVIFAIGVMLATRLLVISVQVVVVFALIMAGATLAGLHVDVFLLFSLFFAVLMLLMLATRGIDRQFGAHLRDGGMPRRVLAAVLRSYARSGVGRRSEVMALLVSHGNERLFNVSTVIAFTTLVMAMMFGLSSMKSPAQVGSYSLFPQSVDSSNLLNSAHYDDQRDPLHDPATPFVQSAVIDGPYLRLTVPYQPQHDAAAIRSHCAAALNQPAGEARGNALLGCLTGLHGTSLDGRPLTSLRYAVGTDPRTARPALQAMIDVRSLPNGRHLLRVERASTSPQERTSDNNDAYLIAFWR